MQINPTALDGVLELVPHFFKDERGFFVESYSRRHFIEAVTCSPQMYPV